MKSNVQFNSNDISARVRFYGATILAVSLACGVGAALAEGISLGGISAGVSAGSGGVSANVGIGGTSGVNAGASVGGTTGVNAGVSVGGVAGLGTGTAAGTGVQVKVGVGPVVKKVNHPTKSTAKPATPVAILGPKSVLGVDTNVLGLDVVADVLEYNGNLLDVCIGSCRVTAVGGGGGGGGGGNPGGGGGTIPGGGVIATNAPGDPGTVAAESIQAQPVSMVNLGTGDPCGEGAAAARATNASMSTGPQNGNPGPSFAISTADLNLPMQGVELRCSAGGNAQVFNGYSVVDVNGEKIGVVQDAFLTGELKIRRIQFQGIDQRCFGLSNGKYKVSGNNVVVDVPASFVYQ